MSEAYDKVSFTCCCGASVTYHAEIGGHRIEKWHTDHKKCLEIHQASAASQLDYYNSLGEPKDAPFME